eukprot:CAMPEP_0174270952 /NCGR_PEP_ID=MMETSP0439-20130205/46342_1 /TAXON_ID=0 /ORGANISM="Stereomyxa ramosa, Strain Chinc5" /LENGTH=286 /DNA_ID=CAMNT_0015360649 /DNA_START=163 /DNA_END=1024 /DNA_ORIENTATION=+
MDKKDLMESGATEHVDREIAILKRLRHKNVLQLEEVMVSSTRIYIVTELLTGGELFFKLANEGKFDEKVSRKYFRQLILGVEYCHFQGICHRDIKPENLLLDDEGNLKITDFGLAALFKTQQGGVKLLKTMCGTPNYVAPEVLMKRKYDGCKADIWSCGCVLYTFLTGYMPFHDTNMAVLYQQIKNAEYKVPKWLSSDAAELLRQMLTPEPDQRITIAAIRQNDWFNENYSESEKGERDSITLSDFDSSSDTEVSEVEEVDLRSEEKNHSGMKTANAFDLKPELVP